MEEQLTSVAKMSGSGVEGLLGSGLSAGLVVWVEAW